MASQTKPGGHWSAQNPVPTIQQFLQGLDKDKADRDKQIDEAAQKAQREQRQHRQRHETEAVPHKPAPGSKNRRRTVTDPTTGREVEIDDVGKEFMQAVEEPQLTVPNANLGIPTKAQTRPDQQYSDYKYNQDITAPPDPIAEGTTSDVPIHGEKTNVLFHPTPSISFDPMYKSLEKRGTILSATIFFAILIFGKLAGGSLKIMFLLSACVVSAVWLWMQDYIRKGRDYEWRAEQLRGETATANLLPESVEWLNSLLQVAWGLINPDMFAGVADTMEDVMQASMPGVIENIRVAEIDQGTNPFRILSLRSLPESHAKELTDGMREHNQENKPEEEAAAEEEGGESYTLECSFAYHAKPTGESSAAKAANMHMLMVFYLGVKGLFGVPLPIFAELIEVVGTVRLRLLLTPQAPYTKTLTFSLMGLPHVRAGCVPMVKRGVNILNLPLISNFVNYAIGAVANLYVAPKSMTLDIAGLLQGDDIQKETLAMGILWVRIHRAVGLSKQDTRGSNGGGSDPYINLSFSKYGKPMYCTRVICDDLNPVWEESAALLVTPELIKADEQLSIELWDSDRNTADDIVGKIEVSMQKMIQHPAKMYNMVSKLRGMDAGSEMPGELHWQVGYFGKPHMRPELRTDGNNPQGLPKGLEDHPRLQDEKGNILNDEQDAVVHTPPDPLWPSGICSVVVHQIVNLQYARIKGTLGDRKNNEYGPAREYGENTEEQGKNLPSSYCTILLNDTLVYRTRAKAVSSKPIFNAGTERFIRDWRSAIVTVTVRDQRYREHDPILGVVPLKLSDILQNRSQVTRWYPMDGGVGYGRIRVSLLFRGVETRLSRHVLGWDVGTFKIVSDRITMEGFKHHHVKIKLRTSGCSSSLPKSASHPAAEGGGSYVDISSEGSKYRTHLPIQHRHRSAVIMELHNGSITGYAVLWMQHLVDNEDIPLDLPIWTTKNEQRLTQNFITEQNWKQKRSPGLEDLSIVGRLQFTCRFAPGLSEAHERLIDNNQMRETYETWEACVAEGVRDRDISAEVPENIRQLHHKSLVAERDVLRQGKAEEREQWLTKNGLDWSLAFGDNPHALADYGDQSLSDPDLERESQKSKESINQQQGDGQDGLPPTNGEQRPLEQRSSQDGSNRVNNESNEDTDDGDSLTTTGGDHEADYETREDRKRRVGNKANKRTEKRKLRGSMQWTPARNAAFVKDEASFALKRVKNKFGGGLTGREPDVETEMG